jgi:colanic acid/amylovoran biosynthesis protein
VKILIIEAYSAANIGSGALVENSVRLLQKNFPGADIQILAQSPESIQKLTGLRCHHELIILPLQQHRVKQVLWLMSTTLWMCLHIVAARLRRFGLIIPESLYTFDPKALRAVMMVREADMIVSVGAERINDNFYKAIIFSLYTLWVVQGYKKFLVLFPQTIGPFHSAVTRFLSSKVLSGCDVVFLRDRKSADIVKAIGVSGPLIVNTCDVAVLQPAIDADKAKRLLKEAGVPVNGKPLVGISVMQWSYIRAKGKSGYQDYKRAIATVADEFIEKKGAHILFIATNVLAEGCREDDVAAARDVMELMRRPDGATILGKVYTPAQMKGIMGTLEFCLVTRMHACIFSTGICTPTASINYQFKLKEYMKLIGLGDYTVDIDAVTADELRNLLERAWNDRESTRELLRQNITAWAAKLEAEMARLPEYYVNKSKH